MKWVLVAFPGDEVKREAEHSPSANAQFKNTVIPRYTSNRFTSFRLYEMHKLIPVFQFMSQFSLSRAPSSRKPIVVPGASSREGEINFRFTSFRITSSFGGTN
jgi:hypothetical protein